MYCADTCQTTLGALYFAALHWFHSVYMSVQACQALAEQEGIKVMPLPSNQPILTCWQANRNS